MIDSSQLPGESYKGKPNSAQKYRVASGMAIFTLESPAEQNYGWLWHSVHMLDKRVWGGDLGVTFARHIIMDLI